MLKTFFINSTEANYGEEEFNYLQKFLLDQGVLHTQGANWNDFIDLEVTEKDTPDMSVNVAIGNAVIETERNSVTFKVFVFNNAETNLPIAENTSGTTRMDSVIIKLSRTVEPNALMTNVASLEVVTGTSDSALTDNEIQTEIGEEYDFLRLANVAVDNGETTILDADVADTRTRVLTTDAVQYSPTVLKFKVVTTDPTSPVEGEMWYNETDNKMRYYDGTATINMETSVFTGGDGIDITSGNISIDLADGSSLIFEGGKLKTDSIDPDNLVEQTPAKLIGGTDIVISNFSTLASGLNDGSFKVSLNGTEYDNVLFDSNIDKLNEQTTGSNTSNPTNTNYLGQVFTAYHNTIDSISLYAKQDDTGAGNANLYIYEVDINDEPIGEPLYSENFSFAGWSTTYQWREFTIGIDVVAGKRYAILLLGPSSTASYNPQWSYYSTPNSYEDGHRISGNFSGWNTSSDDSQAFRVIGGTGLTDGELLADALNLSIVKETGDDNYRTIYNTDHLEIYNNAYKGKYNYFVISKFEAPTTGTDISGAGYLDLADNATEVAGQGDDYKLARLDENGKIPKELNLIDIGKTPTSQTRAKDTVYQNTKDNSIIVYATFQIVNDDSGSLSIGSTSTPDKQIAQFQTTNNYSGTATFKMPFSFIVPAGYYYSFTGNITLISWYETDL